MNSSNVVTLIIDGKNKAVTAVKDAIGNLTELDNAAKKSNSNMGSIFDSVSSIAAIAGIGLTAGALFSFGKDAVIASARLGVLRDNFKGTTQDIELFQRATAGTVTEANLLKLSNQATDLGLTMKEQAILMSLAEDAADKYGGGVEENFQRVLKASEGGTKGLKDLGIQKAIYDEIVKSYLNDYGVKNLNQLDAETQKWLQVEAMIKATGVTLDDVAKKLPDAADKIEAIGVKWDKFKNKSGEVLLPVLGSIIGTIIDLDDWAIKAGNDLDRILGIKGFLGNGDQTKPQDNTQNQADLENALSYHTYVDKNGKLIRDEIKKVANFSADEIEAQSKKVQDALDKVKKKAEDIKKASDLITFENSLIGLDDVDRELMQLLKQAEDWKNQGIDISLVNETTLLRSDDLIRKALAAKLKAREDSDVQEQRLRDKEYDAELDQANRLVDLYIDSEDKKYWAAKARVEKEKSERAEQFNLVAEMFGNMAGVAQMFYDQSGQQSQAAFNAYKLFAIAQGTTAGILATIETFESVTKYFGPVAGYIAAAAAGAFALSNINRIANMKLGGGAAGGGGGYSSPSAAQSYSNSSSTTNNNSNIKNIHITIHSVGGFGSSTDKLVRDELAPAIQKAINDGIIDFN
ncbi:MAG: hypothetical protein NTX65_03180 [Ignavibacteriales bacterium]|nr:hypothetical protein [Ignavibacteriales bacterium]